MSNSPDKPAASTAAITPTASTAAITPTASTAAITPTASTAAITPTSRGPFPPAGPPPPLSPEEIAKKKAAEDMLKTEQGAPKPKAASLNIVDGDEKKDKAKLDVEGEQEEKNKNKKGGPQEKKDDMGISWESVGRGIFVILGKALDSVPVLNLVTDRLREYRLSPDEEKPKPKMDAKEKAGPKEEPKEKVDGDKSPPISATTAPFKAVEKEIHELQQGADVVKPKPGSQPPPPGGETPAFNAKKEEKTFDEELAIVMAKKAGLKPDLEQDEVINPKKPDVANRRPSLS